MGRRVTLNDERIAKIVDAADDAITDARIDALRGDWLASLTHSGCVNLDNQLEALGESIADAITIAIIDITGPIDEQ